MTSTELSAAGLAVATGEGGRDDSNPNILQKCPVIAGFDCMGQGREWNLWATALLSTACLCLGLVNTLQNFM